MGKKQERLLNTHKQRRLGFVVILVVELGEHLLHVHSDLEVVNTVAKVNIVKKILNRGKKNTIRFSGRCCTRLISSFGSMWR